LTVISGPVQWDVNIAARQDGADYDAEQYTLRHGVTVEHHQRAEDFRRRQSIVFVATAHLQQRHCGHRPSSVDDDHARRTALRPAGPSDIFSNVLVTVSINQSVALPTITKVYMK